jgi:hypothetical protein
MPMKKLIFLTSAMMLLATPAVAKDVKRVISPEDLLQEAKKHCPANATTPEGWAELRKCIAKAKGEIINEKDPRIAKACEKYSGEERNQCTDWHYVKGPSASSYSPLRYRMYLQEHCAGAGCIGGGAPGEQAKPSTAPEHTPGGVTGGRNTSRVNTYNDPRSDRSTITGTPRGGSLNSGGATNTISRPSFLGGGSQGYKGGIELGGEVDEHPGNLDGIHDTLKDLPR